MQRAIGIVDIGSINNKHGHLHNLWCELESSACGMSHKCVTVSMHWLVVIVLSGTHWPLAQGQGSTGCHSTVLSTFALFWKQFLEHRVGTDDTVSRVVIKLAITIVV